MLLNSKKLIKLLNFQTTKYIYNEFHIFKCPYVHQEELLLQKLQCFQYPIFSQQHLFCAENKSANPAPKNRPLAPETKEFLHELSVLYLTPSLSPRQME